MTRDELNTFLLYKINDNLASLMLMFADYLVTNQCVGKESLEHIENLIASNQDAQKIAHDAMIELSKEGE
jgi:hypothetical protein